MKINTWTNNEIELLIKHFSNDGIQKCLEVINYPESKIRRMAHKLGLKINKNVKKKYTGKSNDKCNVNPNLFYNINTKEVSYLLGLIWADGFFNSSKNGKNHNFGITMIKNDIDKIKNVLNTIGKWYYYERNHLIGTWKPSVNVMTNNKRIFNFLIDHDYDKKSYVSADKILSKIPNELKHYFFRGLIDGDGCFYYRSKIDSTIRQFTITSTYNQDWSYVEDIFKYLNIKYNIKRTYNTKSSYSIIRITNKNGIIKFGDYVYSNYDDDEIGLNRKYDKYMQIKNS